MGKKAKRINWDNILTIFGVIMMILLFTFMLGVCWYIMIADLFYNELSILKKIVGWIMVPVGTFGIGLCFKLEWIPILKSCFRKEI